MNNKQSKNVRDRRLLRPVPVSKSAQLFSLPVTFATDGFRGLMLEWIADYTIGEFYLSSSVLYFCNEQDAMAYKLYNARKKCEEQIALEKQRPSGDEVHGSLCTLSKAYCGRLK